MTLHDIIQKNSEMFDALIGEVPEHAKYIIDKYSKDGVCVMCGHPASANKVVSELKSHLLSSQLSIIQAIDEMIEEVIKNKEQVNGFQPYHTCDEECEVHCKKERDERKIFFDGFDDGRNMMKIDLMRIRSFLNAKTKLQ